MNNIPTFDFTVDKAAKTVVIKKEFTAGLSFVWDAFTKAELIDQWIAPKPYTAKTRYQDFKVGGQKILCNDQPRRGRALGYTGVYFHYPENQL